MRLRNRPLHLRLPLALLAALLAVLGTAPGLAAQTQGDEGTFLVFVNGRQIGTEQFTIRETGQGSNAEVLAGGRVELALPTGQLLLNSRLRATGFRADPVAYEVDIEGDAPRSISGTVGGGRFSARITSPSGEQLREYVASSGATVLDEAVAHHYHFLARRARSGRVPVIIPRQNRQVLATVVDRGEERIRIGDQQVVAYHLVVTPEGAAERHVWVDDLNRVLQVEIPSEGYRAVRDELPR